MDPPPHEPMPERMSALYQYHNAPEVAPAHGLEYDDTIYPSSDKYPVLREHFFDVKNARFGFENNGQPPRIIFGMKVRTFLLVAFVMTLVIVGAAVGGAVGGAQLRNSTSQDGLATGNAPSVTTTQLPSATSSTPTGSSTFSAAVPTYTPLSDCPASNNTTYTSSFAAGSSGTVPSNSGLTFTKYCDRADPLSLAAASAVRIAEAFVYSFSDCIDVCASYNFWNNGSDCSVAVYQPTGGRPGNCWVGNAGGVQLSMLKATPGTDVSFLDES